MKKKKKDGREICGYHSKIYYSHKCQPKEECELKKIVTNISYWFLLAERFHLTVSSSFTTKKQC